MNKISIVFGLREIFARLGYLLLTINNVGIALIALAENYFLNLSEYDITIHNTQYNYTGQ